MVATFALRRAVLVLSLGIASAGAGETAVRRDIPYLSDVALASASAYQKERCRLDMYVPKGETGFPTVVWFHGGGLVGGKKHFIRVDEKIAQVAANYRFLQKDGSVTGDDCIDDAAAAVVWTLKNVAAFGGEPFVFTPESAVAPKRENEPREGERGGGGGENADVRNVFHD